MELTANLEGYVEPYLALEYEASAPYTSFVYDTREQALAVQRYLFEQRAGEFSQPHGRAALIGGSLVGMLAALRGDELARARLVAAAKLARSELTPAPHVQRRMRTAAQTLMRPAASDYFLSRLAVAEEARSQGVGTGLIQRVVEAADAAGAARIVLEVAAGAAARRLYERCGFVELTRERVVDDETGRELEYVHMARTVG